MLSMFALYLLLILLVCHPASSRTIDFGTQRFGWDLHSLPLDSDNSQQCLQRCEEEQRCISWSYRRPNCTTLPKVAAGCWLKQALAGAQLDSCSDSGWIEERMTPRCEESEYREWPRSQRGGDSMVSPVELSSAILGLQLAVNCTISYTKSDTWYCSWAEDDTLRCMFEDGSVNNVKVNGHPRDQPALATSGVVTVVGGHPFNLSLQNARVVFSNLSGYIGRFPSANIYHEGVWYVANAVRNSNNTYIANCGGHCVMGPLVSFMTSRDEGRSWDDPLPLPDATHNLWQQDSGDRLSQHVKFGEVHVVDFGRAQQHSIEGYTYVIGHGSDESFGESWELWNQGDALYMARVRLSVSSVNDAERWEFWCGDEGDWVTGAVAGGGLDCATPLLVWPSHTGSVSMTYVPSLDRYLTIYTTPHFANWPLNGSDLVLLESTSITGPFRLVDQLDLFGPTAYFPTLPSKFIAPQLTVDSIATAVGDTAELRLWLAFSTLSTYKYGTFGDPPFTAYAWNVMAAKLIVSMAALAEADTKEAPLRTVLVGDVLAAPGEVAAMPGVWQFVRLLVWLMFVVLCIGVVRLASCSVRQSDEQATVRSRCGKYAYSMVGSSE